MDVVASACHVVVDADSTGNSGRLTFGTYRKSTGASVPPRDFTVRLYDFGATVQGCSAFKAGQVATLDFGGPGLLDAEGVVTRGDGEGIRVDVRAVDTQADYRGRLTLDSHSVNYPVEFAAKGQFRFRAQPVFPANVKAGEYSGALTFVVTISNGEKDCVCRKEGSRRAALALAVSAAFASATGVAGEKLDMSFIQGGAGGNPDVWAALNGSYAPGRYLVDLSLNGKEARRRGIRTGRDVAGQWAERDGCTVRNAATGAESPTLFPVTDESEFWQWHECGG